MASRNCFSYSLPSALKRVDFDSLGVARADGTECDYVVRMSKNGGSYQNGNYQNYLTQMANNASYAQIIDDGSNAMVNNLAD